MAQLAVTIVAALGLLCGCGNHGGGDTDGGDGGQGADANPLGCVGPTVCQGTSVHSCRAGKPGGVLEECAPDRSCSLGRCISISCGQAERDVDSIQGCLFYTFDLDNVTNDDPLPTSVLVTNPGQSVATASLARRQGGTWVDVTSMPVAPMRSARFVLPPPPPPSTADGGVEPKSAFRVTSDVPLLAAHVQSDDSTPGGSTSSGGTLLLPAHVLGLRYRAMTFVQTATPRILDTPGSRGGAGQIAIIGTRAGTAVTVTGAGKGSFGPEGNAPVTGPTGSFVVTLDEGELYQIFGIHDGDDLTGTEIEANKPIAVFSGNISTTYGVTATGISSPDLAHEQLLPVTSWGQSYIAAALTPQAGVCDPLLDPPGASLWRILADRDDTMVTFTKPTGSADLPPPRVLKAGESFQVAVAGSFMVKATRPVLVMQGMDCEPTLSSAVATNPLLKDYRFAVLPSFDTTVAIVRSGKRPIYVDNELIAESRFEHVAGEYDVATVQLEPCSPSDVVCTHHVEGQFGLTLRAMDVQCSYALTAPTWVPCTEPGVPGCLN